jgi:hypothetical protein
LAPRAQPEAQQTPPKGNKKPCQNPLFRDGEYFLLCLFGRGLGLEKFSNTSFAKNLAPSANKRSGKEENPVPTEGTNTINFFVYFDCNKLQSKIINYSRNTQKKFSFKTPTKPGLDLLVWVGFCLRSNQWQTISLPKPGLGLRFGGGFDGKLFCI